MRDCQVRQVDNFFQIHQIHQIDLVDMKKQKIAHKGKTYRYVLSLLDVFSRFHWLYPLTSKHSANVARELKNIYTIHGTPRILQSDRGKEFYGETKRFCEQKKIILIKSRAYHPQSQGKVERSHRTLRKKITYDLVKHGKKGVSWVSKLQQYAKCLNDEKREELGWRSPFEVYFGRKSNELLQCGVPVAEKNVTEKDIIRPTNNEVDSHLEKIKKQRVLVKQADEKIRNRVTAYHRKRFKCSQYSKNERVFIRLGHHRGAKKAPKQRFVTNGTVLKVGKDENTYKVEFIDPITECSRKEWFSVEDIADFDSQSKRTKQNHSKRKKEYQRKLRVPITRQDRYEAFQDQGFRVTYNPPGDGNCQFNAICHALRKFGIFRSPSSLRLEIVKYLEDNEFDQDGFPLELFAGMPYSQYLAEMTMDGTYGDHLTLRAASQLFNLRFMIISTIGNHAAVEIDSEFEPMGTIILGHFAEGRGDHYVCLREEISTLEIHNDYEMNEDVEEFIDVYEEHMMNSYSNKDINEELESLPNEDNDLMIEHDEQEIELGEEVEELMDEGQDFVIERYDQEIDEEVEESAKEDQNLVVENNDQDIDEDEQDHEKMNDYTEEITERKEDLENEQDQQLDDMHCNILNHSSGIITRRM